MDITTSTWQQRALAVIASAIMMCFGVTGLASAATLDTTGPNSTNSINGSVDTDCSVENNTDITLDNDSDQTAVSGDAEATQNTEAGDVETGDAENENSLEGEVTVDNSDAAQACVCVAPAAMPAFDSASIENTGPNSDNEITTDVTTDVTVENNTDVNVDVTNDQTAVSGDAEATQNTEAGSVETGDATNENSTNFIANIDNELALPASAPFVPAAVAADCDDGTNPGVTPGQGNNGGGRGGEGPHASYHHYGPAKAYHRGSGAGYGSGSSKSYHAPKTYAKPAAHHKSAPKAVAPAAHTPSQPSGGSGGGNHQPTAPAASGPSISNTGPGSSNTISYTSDTNVSVTNNNNVSYTSTNNQTAVSGSSTSSGNTSTDSGASGDASNANDADAAVGIKN